MRPDEKILDRLEDLTRSIRLLRKLAIGNREWAEGVFGGWDWRLKEKWLKSARRKEKGAARLCRTLARECDKLKEHYQT